MKPFFQKQLQYNHWANGQLIETLQSLSNPPERALQLIAHIVGIENNWLKRLGLSNEMADHFPTWNLEEVKRIASQNLTSYTMLLDSISDFEKTIQVTILNETSPRTLTIGDSLTHVFSHSNYHRAQIVTLLKGHVDPLPFVTYIAWASKKEYR
jgi:uncharacterized damage-inducible protein DinB